jgi:hypothetical protein
MGKEISARWKNTSNKDRERFEALAKLDAERYKKEVQIYEEEQVLKAREEREKSHQQQKGEETATKKTATKRSVKKASASAAHQARGGALSPFTEGPSSELAASTIKAMEEKNHPDAPQRLSPRFRPMPLPSNSNVGFGGDSASALNHMRMQMALGQMPPQQQQQPVQPQQMNYSGMLEELQQLRRREEAALISQEYFRRQQQEQALAHALGIGGVNFQNPAGGGGGGIPMSLMGGSNHQTLQQLLSQNYAAASLFEGAGLGFGQLFPNSFQNNPNDSSGRGPPNNNNPNNNYNS